MDSYSKRSPQRIVEDIKAQILTFSKAGKASEQMFGNLQKKDFQNMDYTKPATPQQYAPVKEHIKDKKFKISTIKKKEKDNKINSSFFRSISRGKRQQITDPKLVVPTLNQFGNLPKFWTQKDCKLHISTVERGSLEEKRRLRELDEQEKTKIEYEQMIPQLGRNRSMVGNIMTLNASKSNHKLDEETTEGDETMRDIEHIRNQLQQQNQNQGAMTINQSLSTLKPQGNNVSNTLLSRSASLPELERSQVQPYLMNFKFSRQSKRKPLIIGDVNEQRFENNNLFPDTLTKNKKLIWNIKIDKYSKRDQPWTDQSQPKPEYDPVDLEKYKFKKTQQVRIMDQKSQNRNHYAVVSRYY